ncbi:DtxR family Mn-dependent transcriptional regulator [Kineococcus xinjiangensis]|uniref:Manganese transport regulator n=1 Tax=Kineococcus xinjiangensis TaxID=512762 RepID=A0A2S6IDG9_9ACTN|nr:metal-dependent transcriptional regulator [Kineococcus xinjiangensis]PPK92268.1 DtxR family Mn-dependent transcriptional regulator [Kineococcus xinjiangensis]
MPRPRTTPAPDLTSTTEDYLKEVWTAREWTDEPVTTSLLAQRMGFSRSTVSEAVRKLTDQGLLAHERYGSIELTEEGRAAAVGMVRRHRLIETFLVEYLGYGWDEVHDEAEVFEHAVSDKFVERLAQRLGDPDRDPHGDPIPRRDGTFPDLPATRLDAAGVGRPLQVARVSDSAPDLLRYLGEVGITLDVVLTVLARQEFAGTLLVEAAGRRFDLGLPAAASIWVVEPGAA